MPDSESTHHTELPKIVDDGTNNNYGEWRTQAYHKLLDWDLWKYIEGPDSIPPFIPPLIQPIEHHGLDENDQIFTVRVLGNAAEHHQAMINARPWMTGNTTTLCHIIAAIPGKQLHIIQQTKYAKQAWECLRSVYQPRNSLCASTIKGQIMAYLI
jgi:hypothetical protein